jgi:ribosomal protein S17E
MGKIKSKEIRRSARELNKNKIKFSKDFEENKQILAKVPMGKKLRNQLAGLLAKTKKQE